MQVVAKLPRLVVIMITGALLSNQKKKLVSLIGSRHLSYEKEGKDH